MERLWVSDVFMPSTQGVEEIFEEDDKGNKKRKIILEGEFSSTKPNRNKRQITEEVLRRETDSLNKTIKTRGGVIAENGHPKLDPDDPKSMQRAITASFDRAAGIIKYLEWHPTKEIVYGKAEILYETDCGKPIAAIAQRGVKVGISSRGVGGKGTATSDGITIYPNDFRLITFDFVENESNYGSVLSMYEESYNRFVEEYEKKQKSLWDVFQKHLKKTN